ncbi:thioredoxin domain-containing protein [Yersinia ruckeri]
MKSKVKLITSLMMLMPAIGICSGAAPLTLNEELLVKNEQTRSSIISLAEKNISKYGNVVAHKKISSDITQWLISSNGREVILFTTNSGDAIFSGTIWDATTGKMVSASEMHKENAVSAQVPVPVPAPVGSQAIFAADGSVTTQEMPYAMQGSYTGAIPEVMKVLDGLAGYKEGKGSIGDTVYIFIDPRCPHCHNAFARSRGYIANGFTIKWIPTVALGPANEYMPDGIPISAAIIQRQDYNVFAQNMTKNVSNVTEVATEETKKQLDANFTFLMDAFKARPEIKRAGVPAAFMIDHRTGRPKLVMGISEAEVLIDVFGKSKLDIGNN